jgi:hypothetical protein
MAVLCVAFFLLSRSMWEQLAAQLATHKKMPQVLRFLLAFSLAGLLANIWTGFLPAALIVQAATLWTGQVAREKHALSQGSAIMSLLIVIMGAEIIIHALIVLFKAL